jgi:hypothetical protein
MSRFKLICEDEAIPFGGASKITQEFDTDDLVFILGNMTKFLQIAGYLDNSKYLSLERTVNLDITEEDLDEYTEKLFTNTEGEIVGPADC